MADDTDDARDDRRVGAADDDVPSDDTDQDSEPDAGSAGAAGSAPDDAEAAIIAAARRRHGSFGAVVAAGMLGFEKLLGRKPREEAPVVVAAPTDPIDIDVGIQDLGHSRTLRGGRTGAVDDRNQSVTGRFNERGRLVGALGATRQWE